MILKPGDRIVGYPAMQIREVLGDLRYGPINWQRHGIPDVVGGELEVQLVHEGYLQPHWAAESWPEKRAERLFMLTMKGKRLALASARAYKRATVIKTLEGVIERAQEINRREDYYAYRVQALVVFGSYLTSAERLGDLDLAVALERLFDATRDGSYEKWAARFCERAPIGSSFIAQLGWGREEVLRKLKKRSPIVSIHSTDDAVLGRTPYRVVFGEWAGPVPEVEES